MLIPRVISLLGISVFVFDLASSQTPTLTSKTPPAESWNVTMEPVSIHQLPMGISWNISMTIIGTDPNDLYDYRIIADISNKKVARVLNENDTVTFIAQSCTAQFGCLIKGYITIHGVFLGFTEMNMKMLSTTKKSLYEKYSISIIRAESKLNQIFPLLIVVVICLMNLTFGCEFDLNKAKEIFKKPVAPLIGFLCQYTIMPSVRTFLFFSCINYH